ncbi:UNVERIFIED_CONTAM: hypothetical protein HDU68_002095 [Siphonaria sp. JEL0065]|nr:hypothetical protein HDU68_002095 [Siphonaria sp. JEL0065]
MAMAESWRTAAAKRKTPSATQSGNDNEADDERDPGSDMNVSLIQPLPPPPPPSISGIKSLGWNEDEPASNSNDSKKGAAVEDLPLRLDPDDSDIELAAEVAGTIDSDTILAIDWTGDNDGDRGKPDSNSTSKPQKAQKHTSVFDGPTPTQQHLQL